MSVYHVTGGPDYWYVRKGTFLEECINEASAYHLAHRLSELEVLKEDLVQQNREAVRLKDRETLAGSLDLEI